MLKILRHFSKHSCVFQKTQDAYRGPVSLLKQAYEETESRALLSCRFAPKRLDDRKGGLGCPRPRFDHHPLSRLGQQHQDPWEAA